MTATINASTTAGVVTTADTSGILQLQTNGTAALTVDASQRTAFVAGTAALPAITTTGDTNTGIFFPAADTIAFSEGGAEAMRIDSSANVGIGTSSPAAKFNVVGGRSNFAPNSENFAVYLQHNSATNGFYIGSPSADAMVFSASSGAERARIDSSGNFLVGRTTTANFTSSTTAGFTWQGTVATISTANTDPLALQRSGSDGAIVTLFKQNSQVGSISVTTSATAYNTSSDYRLKEAIAPMTGALAKVALLKPCTYKWKLDGSEGQGFIAHELDEVVQGCVTGEKDAVGEEQYEVTPAVKDEEGNIVTEAVMGTRIAPVYQGIDTSFLVATLTAAIQELKAIVDEQAVLIATQGAEIAALKGATA